MYILRIFTYILYQKIATVDENLAFQCQILKVETEIYNSPEK